MAEHLGMDTEKDEDFLWIAAEAYDAEVPPPWKEFFDDSGEVYFHNTRTGDVSRDHPLDHYYRILYGIVRQMADKGLEVDVEVARKDAEMALPDQNMKEAIEESKEKIQQMANNPTMAKYVPQSNKTDLEHMVYDLQMALKRAEQERLEHERRVSELSAKVMTIQTKGGTPVDQDIINSLQARLSRIESAGYQNGGGGPGAAAPASNVSGDVGDRLARLERESSEAAKDALRAHRERADYQAEASCKIETLEREKADLEQRLAKAEGRPAGAGTASAGMQKEKLLPLLDIQKKLRELSACASTAKTEASKQTSRFGSALSIYSCNEDDPMTWAIQSLVKKLKSMSVAARSAVEQAEKKIGPVMAERRRLFNELLRAKGNIRVFCRVRPLDRKEEGSISCVDFPNEDRANRQIALVPQESQSQQNGRSMTRKDFEFDRVFDESSSQTLVYEESVKPLVQSALDGFNVCIFAYGQTGSGKTHTMEGPEHDRGVTFRAIKELFDLANGECSVPGVVEYTFQLSMLEIYNEQIKDLLEEKATTVVSKKLDIKMREDGLGVHVPNLTEKPVSTAEEVLQLLHVGSKNRSVGVTMMNEHSSRSHLVMMISCVSHNLSKQTTFTSKISFIDLAGSERVSKSCAEGERLKEASYINKSLSALGYVIASLASAQTRSGSSHIPFRNSKLTYLLSDSLGNDCKTMVFVNISPSLIHAHESLCSLMFAFRARNVNLSSNSAGLSNVKKLREVAELAKRQQQSLSSEKGSLEQKIALLRKEVAEKDETIAEMKSSAKQSAFQPPPPTCPPPVTKPMRQHNAKVEADTKDLGQQLILLRETNKSLTERSRSQGGEGQDAEGHGEEGGAVQGDLGQVPEGQLLAEGERRDQQAQAQEQGQEQAGHGRRGLTL